MKKLLLLILIAAFFIFPACASLPEAPPVEPIKVELPNKPVDYTEELNKIRNSLGAAPTPKVIKQNGITYFGFTKQQMVQFRLFNEAFAQLENIIISQQKQVNIYFMHIETLKALAEAQNAQAKKYRELYEAARSEVKRKEIEALGYRILTIGSIVAIIALAL